MNLRIQKLHDDAIVPTYAHEYDACFDLYTITSGYLYVDRPMTFRTGLAVEIPAGFMMLIFSRSGHGFNHGVRLGNCVGVIDAGYREEVKVRLTRDDPTAPMLKIQPGERIAQACIIPVEMTTFEVVKKLSATKRGAGFGSSGA